MINMPPTVHRMLVLWSKWGLSGNCTMLLGVYLLFAPHAVFHLWCVCVCVCVSSTCLAVMLLFLLVFNWLVTVTMVAVLWKSSLPTTSEMPPQAYLNVIFACCLHINGRPVCHLVCVFHGLIFYACLCRVVFWVACWRQRCFCSCAAVVAVAAESSCALDFGVWKLLIIFAWILLHVLCLFYACVFTACVPLCVERPNHFPFNTIWSTHLQKQP